MKNHVSLIGRLGRDPEVKEVNGKKVMNLSIATSKSWKVGEEWRQETEWHRVSLWGSNAESLSEKLKKGSLAAVEGEIHYGNGKDKKIYPEIKADRVLSLEGKNYRINF